MVDAEQGSLVSVVSDFSSVAFAITKLSNENGIFCHQTAFTHLHLKDVFAG